MALWQDELCKQIVPCQSRDSSVGRASDRRSEGPRSNPGSRHERCGQPRRLASSSSAPVGRPGAVPGRAKPGVGTAGLGRARVAPVGSAGRGPGRPGAGQIGRARVAPGEVGRTRSCAGRAGWVGRARAGSVGRGSRRSGAGRVGRARVGSIGRTTARAAVQLNAPSPNRNAALRRRISAKRLGAPQELSWRIGSCASAQPRLHSQRPNRGSGRDASRLRGHLTLISGVAQWLACWAHNPKVRGSKPRSAMRLRASAVLRPVSSAVFGARRSLAAARARAASQTSWRCAGANRAPWISPQSGARCGAAPLERPGS